MSNGGDQAEAAPRVAVKVDVELRFGDVGSFFRSVSENLSLGGMFLRTENPRPVGSTFRFRFALADAEASLIEGTGKVVWIREEAAPGRPRGMGVRFLDVGSGGRRVIDKVVAMRLEGEGRPR